MQLGKLVDGQIILPSTMLKGVLVVMSTSTTCSGQISDLHVQIDELKDTLCDAKKSYRNTEAALTKEHSHVKDLK